ncbi:MAG TPA: geranyl transferase [Sulfurospirillum sp. UBA12182]|nr:MAG TPA: geranyl transferase [Sulfurospirillum sp. UBA12182]
MEKELLTQFEEFLQTHLPRIDSFHPHFNDALAQMLNAGGKRFRPLLLLSVVQNCEPLLVKNAMYAALSLELLHTYSLIHDDLPCMDDAALRRGNPTLHVSFDEVTAVLVGDALNTHAFNILANAPLSCETKLELINILSRDGGISGMIIGQAIDCEFENQKLSLEQLKFLHVNKTAKLIAASILMGAVICGLDKQTKENLYNFGLKLGLLFQVEDDIIDVTKSSAQAGKTTSNDSNKNSFVNLLGLEGALKSKQEMLKELHDELLNIDSKVRVTLERIVDKYFKG